MLGREEELATLHDCRRALGKSAGSLVLVGGEAGIGKTRLLEDFRRVAREGRARTLVTSECLERAQQPFGPLRELVGNLLPGLPTRALPEDVARTLQQLTPEVRGQQTSSPIVALDKAQVFSALIALLQLACLKQAVIFTIEDLQWADPSTLEFLTYVAPRMATLRLMILATYRSEEVKAQQPLLEALGHLLRERTVKCLSLQPLDALNIRVLVLNQAPLGDNAVRAIVERSEGNPFFAEELAKSAQSTRNSNDRQALPLSIRAMFLQRLASLSIKDRRILSHAAVIGYHFDPIILALAIELDIETIAATLQRARDLRIIEDAPRQARLCRFRHSLIQQTIYEELLAYDARRVHERVLETLESLEDQSSHLQALAEHAWIASDAQKTLRYNERAAESAFALSALAVAATCFRRALDAAKDDDDKARLLERLTSVNQAAGNIAEAIETTRQAFSIRLRREQWDDAARLMGFLVGDIVNSTGEGDLSEPENFLREHGQKLSRDARNRLLAFLARVSSAANDFKTVNYYLAQVEEPDSLIPRVRQNYLLSYLNLHANSGELSAWKSVAQQCFNALLASEDPFLAAGGYGAVAYTGMHLKAGTEILRALDFADAIVAKFDYRGFATYAATIRAWHCYLKGDLPAARTLVEQALEDSEAVVAHKALAAVGPLIALALGDEVLATRSLGIYASEDTSRFSGLDGAQTLSARALSRIANGRLGDACVDLRWALRHAAFEQPGAILVLPVAARYLPRDEIASLMQSRVSPAEENITARANGAFVSAIIEHRRGDAAKTQAASREAARLFAELKWPLFEAAALELSGELERARGIRARCGAFEAATPGMAPSLSDPISLLSAREREVADFVTAGLGNLAISERLTINIKTVEKHLSSTFAKLGLRSRAELAAIMTRRNFNK